MMIGKKEINGRYYIRGYLNSSPRERNVYIEFMVDSSQRYTTISKSDAEKNNVDLQTLQIAKAMFEVRNEKVDAYVIPNCVINIPNQSGRPNYSITLPRVHVPFSKISTSSLEPDFSRLGLDFLEKFSIEFHTIGEVDRDQIMILQDKKSSQ